MWIDPLGLFGLAGSLAGGGGFGAGAGAISATDGVSSVHQAAAAAIAVSRSKSEARTAVGRCEKEEQDPCSQFPTRKAAQNQVLIAAGIPVGTKPIARRGIQGWEQYLYARPAGAPLVVSHHPRDADHPCPHWHVGQAKMAGKDVATFNNGAWKYNNAGKITVPHSFN
ncbi:hypothetical protein [Neisseria sp. oral taxon 014]|uniref:hypothetical protein n=1 Tax=Neisseria sp. oral taxon 014 TaxID=641148 RepID=UPI000587704C|nr:hypothetical protein [Neisseria sp. oral taxon 014]